MRNDVDQNYILDLNRRFHDEVEATTYDRRMGVSHAAEAIERTIAEFEKVLGEPLPRGCRVVDVAAGTGNVAVKLALTGWYVEVIAVDISIKSLEIAKASAKRQGKDITLIESDMITLPFADSSVDFMVGCAFLHHLPDPLAFMSEVHRVLKPGAAFVFVGEPTKFGMSAINVTKSPLILANRALRAARKSGQNVFRWDHDNIDVHNFTQRDAHRMLDGFTAPTIVTEGFAAPILDQGLLTPIRLVAGENKIVSGMFKTIGKVLAVADTEIFNRILPLSMKVTLKISGRKPSAGPHGARRSG